MRVLRCLLAHAIFCAGFGEPATAGVEDRRSEDVVRQFYSFLLGDQPPEKGPALFAEPGVFLTGKRTQGEGKADTARLWSWMRSKKATFAFSGLSSADDFARLGLRRIFRVNPKEPPAFIGVTVFATLFPRGRDGIFKEVFFPLESRGASLLINPSAITVNGILLDPAGEFQRQDPLYESLGLR